MPIIGKTIAKELGEMLPGRMPGVSSKVLGRRSPGGIVAAGIGPRKVIDPLGALAVSAGLAGGATNAIYLSQNEPEKIGADIAKMKLGLDEGIEMLRQKALDFTEVPGLYFLMLQQGYQDEMRRQEELKNIQKYGIPAVAEPEVILESGEIKPVFQKGDVADRSRIEKIKRNLQYSLDQLSGSEDGMGNDDLYVRNRLFKAGFDYDDMNNEEINRLLEMGMTPDQVANYIITMNPMIDVAKPTRIYPEFTEEDKMKMLAAGQGMPGVYLDSSSFNMENFPKIQAFVDRMRKKPIEKKEGDEVKKEFPNKGLEALYKSGQKGRDAVEAMGYKAGDEVMSDGKTRIVQLKDILVATPQRFESRVEEMEYYKKLRDEEFLADKEAGVPFRDLQRLYGDLNQYIKRKKKEADIGDSIVDPRGKEFQAGGEAIKDDLESMQMSEDDAMNEMNKLVQSPEVQMIEQLVQVVQQLMAQGVSEAEIKMFLKEQGLDDEDIEALFQMIAESGMDQQGASIDQQLAGMM